MPGMCSDSHISHLMKHKIDCPFFKKVDFIYSIIVSDSGDIL